MLVLRELQFRKADVCQLHRPMFRARNEPIFRRRRTASSHSASPISPEYRPKPIPSTQFKRQEQTADRVPLASRGRLPRCHSCICPIVTKKSRNEAISRSRPRSPSARRRSQKCRPKPICSAPAGQPAYERSREGRYPYPPDLQCANGLPSVWQTLLEKCRAAVDKPCDL